MAEISGLMPQPVNVEFMPSLETEQRVIHLRQFGTPNVSCASSSLLRTPSTQRERLEGHAAEAASQTKPTAKRLTGLRLPKKSLRPAVWPLMLLPFCFLVLDIAEMAGLAKVAHAADAATQAVDVTVGFDGAYKVGTWTSLKFDLIGPAGMVVTPVIRTADPDGHGTLQPLPEVTLSPDQPQQIRGLFRSGKLNGPLQILLMQEEKTIQTIPIRANTASGARALKQGTSFWLAIGKHPVISRGIARWNEMAPASAYLVELPELGSSIWSPAVLDGVDVIVMNADVAITPETSQAIQNWTAAGGKLIIPVGNSVSVLAESPLSDWLPIKPIGQTNVAKLSGIQDVVPRSSMLRTLTTLPAAQLDRNQGIVIASGLSGPLVMRSAYGIGMVTMVAVRMDEGPLASWESESQAHLAGILAGVPLPWDTVSAATNSQRDVHFDPDSVTDLQLQLNQTLDNFEGTSRAAPWAVIGWIALFALIIGPIDYYIVRYWLRRPEWTWLTLTIWTLLASGLAIASGNARNARPETGRQLTSIDIDVTTRVLRGQSWYSYYSDQNQRRRIDVELTPEFKLGIVSSLRTTWVNRPGEGFRGMSGSGGIDESRPQYEFFESQAGINNFPVRQWSTGAVTSEWELREIDPGCIEANLQQSSLNRMVGSLKHNLPGELTDWFLAYGNFAYFERTAPGSAPKPLLPGEEWNVGQAGSNLLRGRLINMMQERTAGRQFTAADDQFQRTAYDSSSTDPLFSQLVSSFYRVLGGESYTGLRNDSLHKLDLSSVIGLRRAVLFGRIKLQAIDFDLDGKTLPLQESSVMVRIILPVEQIERDSDAPPTLDILQPPR